jgi:amino acid permease
MLGKVNILLNSCLACVAYAIFAATNITDVVGFDHDDAMGYPRWLVLAMYPCVATCVCLLDISSLSGVSAVSIVFLVMSLFAMLTAAVPHLEWTMWEAPPTWSLSSLGSFFGLTAFAFAGHSETVTIVSSMKYKEKFSSVLCFVAATALLAFGGIGVVIFSAYGENTKPIVFQNMDSVTADVAKLAMSAVIYLTMPLKLFPAIVIVESYLLSDDPDMEDIPKKQTAIQGKTDAKQPYEEAPPSWPRGGNPAAHASIPREFSSKDLAAELSKITKEFPEPQPLGSVVDESVSEAADYDDWPFVGEPEQILIRVLMASVPIFIALTGVNFAVLLEFVGSFCMGTVSLALPPIMHLKLFWNMKSGQSPWARTCRNMFHVLLAAAGVSATIFSTGQVIVRELL